ncbi:MAG: hypothetical protein V4732_11365 [Pseudomonadota bacterium]
MSVYLESEFVPTSPASVSRKNPLAKVAREHNDHDCSVPAGKSILATYDRKIIKKVTKVT